jgi:putative SOS response-associated peptidase YedK
MINARAETVATFGDSFVKRRCIVPATRFYEWQKAGAEKIPHSIQRNDGFPMSFAGLWASWKGQGRDEWINSCTIIATTPNATMTPLHNRMPVILDDEDIDLWLDPEVSDRVSLQPLLRPTPDDALYVYPISKLENSPATIAHRSSRRCAEDVLQDFGD